MSLHARLSQILCLSVAAAFCTGCVEIGRTDRDAALNSDGDSYYVIGVQPDTAAISIFRGTIANNVFQQIDLLPTSFLGTADDGYIVSRTRAGETLAITYVQLRKDKNDRTGRVLVPCAGSKTLVFTAPSGEHVLYLADVSYVPGGYGNLQSRFSQNYAKAKTYMASHYPKLADKLEPGQPQFLPAEGQGGCAG
jgi:hypothetical protein